MIKAQAFVRCSNLSSVILPSTLFELEGGAFSGCSALKSIALPTNLKELGDNAFSYTSITALPNPWPAGVTRILNDVFGDTIIGNLVIPESVTRIERRAFIKTKITSLTLPSTIKYIGSEAFAYCTSLTTVDFPESVSNISDLAFLGSSNINLASQARLRAVGYTGSF